MCETPAANVMRVKQRSSTLQISQARVLRVRVLVLNLLLCGNALPALQVGASVHGSGNVHLIDGRELF